MLLLGGNASTASRDQSGHFWGGEVSPVRTFCPCSHEKSSESQNVFLHCKNKHTLSLYGPLKKENCVNGTLEIESKMHKEWHESLESRNKCKPEHESRNSLHYFYWVSEQTTKDKGNKHWTYFGSQIIETGVEMMMMTMCENLRHTKWVTTQSVSVSARNCWSSDLEQHTIKSGNFVTWY